MMKIVVTLNMSGNRRCLIETRSSYPKWGQFLFANLSLKPSFCTGATDSDLMVGSFEFPNEFHSALSFKVKQWAYKIIPYVHLSYYINMVNMVLGMGICSTMP